MAQAAVIEHFVSYAGMTSDAQAWATSGAFDGVAALAGVPRSGLLPAAVIALHNNLHVVTLGELSGRINAEPLRRGGKALPAGPIVVVDDTVRSGRTMGALRKSIGRRTRCGRDIVYASLYVRQHSAGAVDIYGTTIPMRSVYAWNWRHVKEMRHYMLDMDGVLFPDGVPADAPVSPLFRPSYPARAIVTGRGTHLKSSTISWLARHRIPYDRIHMMPASTPERDECGGPPGFKARIYTEDTDARLFVESDRLQARSIAGLSSKPVLCTQNWKLYR